jgi:hypothetical protein
MRGYVLMDLGCEDMRCTPLDMDMMGFCEHTNEPSGYVKAQNFLTS